jgi:hypothetical protein
MELFVIGLLLPALLSFVVFLREKHLRRLAEARLEVARVVTQLEKMMLDGRIKAGQVCHDKVHRAMVRSQYAERYSAAWKLWRRPTPDFWKFRKQLHEETSDQPDLRELMARHLYATFRAFRNARPFASVCFVIWVAVFAGGFGVLLVGIWGIKRATKAWQDFKQLAAESYVSLAQTA